MRYYRDSVTELSWKMLQQLRLKHDFMLIGGWAVWLYTESLKSKDIDMVVGLNELSRLRGSYELVKNNRLRKYEFRQGEVEVDVYVAHYSSIGVKAEKILADGRAVKGFLVPSCELLLVLKTTAWMSRRGSAKGRKDLLDIISLLEIAEVESRVLGKWLGEARLKQGVNELTKALQQISQIPELRLNQHQVARRKKDWLVKLGG